MRRLNLHPVLLLSALLLAAGCPPPAPPVPPEDPGYALRDCTARFTYADASSHTRVVVAGEFNGWSETADRLEAQDDGSFSLGLDLDPGDYAYKLVVDGQWLLDPGNPFTIHREGEENSLLRVSDCNAPALTLHAFEARPDGSLRLSAAFEAAKDEVGPDPAAVSVTLDGAPAPGVSFDAETGLLEVALSGLATGKHRLEVTLADLSGRATGPLYLPFWIEARPFDWRGVMYFAFLDRFRNGDAGNDAPVGGVEPIANYQGGDFAGLKDAIEAGYFDALGVDVLWISAPQANPGGSFAGIDGRLYTGYHGYWPSAARETQARFGTLEELREMTAAAHARGIRVIADLVLNHVHAQHPYWIDHADDGWFNGNGSCVCQTCGWEEHALDCWFTPYLPDLDWTRREVLDAMMEDALWWAREADLDGFRVDAVKHFQEVAVRNLRGRLMELERRTGTHYHLVGETFTWTDGHGTISRYIGDDLLDGQFDFPLYWKALQALARGEQTLRDLDDAVRLGESQYPRSALNSPFVGNHDVPRLYSHAAGDIADVAGSGAQEQGWTTPPSSRMDEAAYRKVKLAFTFALTQPGLPLIYYGDEIAMPGAGDPDNRRPMRFDAQVAPLEREVLETVARLGRLRAELPALRTGARRTLWVDDDVYVYVRDAGGDAQAIVALNRGASARRVSVELTGALVGIPRLGFLDRLGGSESVAEGGVLELPIPAAGASIWTPAP